MSSKMERLFKLREMASQRAVTYNTDVIPPSSQTDDRILFRLPKKQILDGKSARVMLSITSTGADSFSTNMSGVFACIKNYTVSVGGTQIKSVGSNASNYLVMKQNQNRKMFNNPSKYLWFEGRQLDASAEASTVNGEELTRYVWEPQTNIKCTQTQAGTYDLMFWLKDLCEIFNGEIPVGLMEDYVYIDIGLKSSSEFAKVFVDNSCSGYAVSQARLVCNFVSYPPEVMNARREVPWVHGYSDTAVTQKAIGAGTSTTIQMSLADKALQSVNLAIPRSSNTALVGDDSSHISQRDGDADFKVNCRVNGDLFCNEDIKASSHLYTVCKDASQDKELYTYAPSCFVVEGNLSSGVYLSNNSTFGSDAVTTVDALAGNLSWVNLSYQPDASQGLSFSNATKCDSKPIELQLTHNANLEDTTALLFCDSVKMMEVSPHGTVNILEHL